MGSNPHQSVSFLWMCIASGYISFLPNKERWLDLCLWCYKEVFFKSIKFWSLLLLPCRQWSFCGFVCCICGFWYKITDFDEITLTGDFDRWLWQSDWFFFFYFDWRINMRQITSIIFYRVYSTGSLHHRRWQEPASWPHRGASHNVLTFPLFAQIEIF